MNILYTPEQIDARIKEIATTLVTEYGDTHPLFVCLLKGAAPFATKLMSEITRQAPNFHPEMDYMTISTYGNERSASQSRVVMDLAPNTEITGRSAVILDDCLDQGHTATFTKQHLLANGAADVKLIVLAQKDVARPGGLSADICGFEAPDKWLVGMGMDDASLAKEAMRWSDFIAVVD